jgi:hypothetical protein
MLRHDTTLEFNLFEANVAGNVATSTPRATWRPAQEDRWRFTEEEIAALEAETEDDETNRFDPWDLGSSFNMEPGLPRGYMVNDDSEIPWDSGITGEGKWWDPYVVE